MQLLGLDHLVLTVASIAASCDFYARVLAMQVVRFGAGRTALAFGRQKINLHEAGKEFDPKAIDRAWRLYPPDPVVSVELGACGQSV